MTAFYESENIFQPESWHNHASCLVELPNGDLVVCWFHGSGERTADDVLVYGSRRRAGSARWSRRFLMADTVDYPDCNPCMFVDRRGRLWLIYATILANEWHTALLKYRVSSDYTRASAPKWSVGDVLHITPGDSFAAAVNAACGAQESSEPHVNEWREHARDKLYRRLGWMGRAHPTLLKDGRIVFPVYSDGFSFSLMAISDDDGGTWHVSSPLVRLGAIQPSVVQRHDGSLAAFMRDNGPFPKRVTIRPVLRPRRDLE